MIDDRTVESYPSIKNGTKLYLVVQKPDVSPLETATKCFKTTGLSGKKIVTLSYCILFGRYYKFGRSTVLSLHRKILSHTNTYVNVSLLIRAEQQIKVVFIPNEKNGCYKFDVDACCASFCGIVALQQMDRFRFGFFAFESQFPCSDSKL